MRGFSAVVAAVLVASTISPGAAVQTAADPDIAGSYRLVERVLPDGTAITPPDIVGLMTFTKGYRNFNIVWPNPDGEPTVISYVAEYELDAETYCETPLHWLQYNLSEPGLKLEAPADKGECSTVSVEGDLVRFPIKGEPVVVEFDGDGFTATAEGQFVDHWTRVE